MKVQYLVPGPMSKGPMGRVPVINAGKAALKIAEGLVSQGLSHSKRGYPTPPKLRSTPQEVVA